jgi:hypothetical protein
VDARLKAMKDRKVSFSFEEWFDIETKMSEAYRLGLSGHWPRVRSLIQPLEVPALQKAYVVVHQTRQTAAEYLAASDQAEYMRGSLLLRAGQAGVLARTTGDLHAALPDGDPERGHSTDQHKIRGSGTPQI